MVARILRAKHNLMKVVVPNLSKNDRDQLYRRDFLLVVPDAEPFRSCIIAAAPVGLD